MNALERFQFPYGTDNYGVLLHDAQTGQTACIDAGDAQATLAALQQKNWRLTHLLITHHHGDHTAGLSQVKSLTGCHVVGPELSSSRIDGLDQLVSDNSEFEFASRTVKAIHTPGHTNDMINYYFAQDALLFTGDTLFSMGCGRLFEGDARMMLASVNKLKVLPPETLIYCAHEYTTTNVRFARDVDPANAALQARAVEVKQQRDAGQATIPTTLQMELDTNPFLRTDDVALRQSLGLENADDVAVFSELRERRNQY